MDLRNNRDYDDELYDETEGEYEALEESVPQHEHVPAAHFTPRDPSRKRERQEALKKKRSSKRRPQKAAAASPAAFGVSDFLGGVKDWAQLLLGTKNARIVGVVCIALAAVLTVTLTVRALYTSQKFLSDGGETLDDNAIQERLITSEQNRDKVTYFLIVGVDKSSTLTDCIWVMCFDNEAHKMDVMQIPRDTYVGSDSKSPHKINAVYANPQTVNWCDKCGRAVTADEVENNRHTECGKKITSRTESNINALIRCINNRLSLPIDHYVLFDFDGFEKVIDAMGGVDITLDQETKVYPNKYQYEVLPAGDNHLDGDMALKFMRNRKIYLEGDLGRVRAQRKIIHAMMDKVSDMSSLEALGVLRAAYGNFNTDMSLEQIRSFIAPVKKCDPESLHMFEMPGEDYWVKPHPSYYLCDEKATMEAENEFMLPYSDKLTEDDIHFPTPRY